MSIVGRQSASHKSTFSRLVFIIINRQSFIATITYIAT